jgi:glycerol-3-phosphate cytidylyltransferase-like family protein
VAKKIPAEPAVDNTRPPNSSCTIEEKKIPAKPAVDNTLILTKLIQIIHHGHDQQVAEQLLEHKGSRRLEKLCQVQ